MSKNYVPNQYSYDNPYDYYDACFSGSEDDECSDVDLDDDDQDDVSADFMSIELEKRGLL